MATSPAAVSPLKRGAFTIWVADKQGKLIDPPPNPPERDRDPDPCNEQAVAIYYVVEESPEAPPKEQIDLQASIEKVCRVITQLYLGPAQPQPEKFRAYYVRLFRAAQLGMEGENALPQVANDTVNEIAIDLIENEAARIKNAYFVLLGKLAAAYSIPFLLGYAAIGLMRQDIGPLLTRVDIDPDYLQGFFLLWVGCFIGVWLSYGIRKKAFGLIDLVRAEEDSLVPAVRLLFAGFLVFGVGLLLSCGFIDIRVGQVSLTNFPNYPMLAFLLGLLSGVSELLLPATIGARAGALFAGIK